KRVGKAQIGRPEMNAQRVAIDDFEARHRRRVIEMARLLRLRARFVAADELAFDEPQPWTLHGRVEQALERIGVVLCRELARLAAERRIGREEDALANTA